jgi:hypothetical protein
MKKLSSVVALTMFLAACGQGQQQEQPAAAPEPAAGPQARPYSTLAQMMRGIPFPNSNIIFDTQTTDPAAAQKPAEGAGASATQQFSSVYGGWQAVENAALALSETANLLLIPGRMCENGRPAPVDQADFRMWAQGLADAGQAAYKAAQSKNLDAMVEVSGTVSEACAMCHEKYRDKDDVKDRCIP